MKQPNITELTRILSAFVFCLLAAYLLPYRVPPYPGFYSDWLTILGVLLLCGHFTIGKTNRISFPLIALVPLVVAAIIFLQTTAGMLLNKWDAIFPITYFIFAAIASVAGAHLAATPDGGKRLCFALTIVHLTAGLLSVAIAALQLAGLDSLLIPYIAVVPRGDALVRPFANLGQPNQLALLFCLAMASAWWLFQTRYIRPCVAVAASLALLWGLAMTQSRIAWIILPLFALAIWFLNRKPDVRHVPGWLIAALAASYIVFTSVLLPALSVLYGAFTSTAAERVLAGGSGRTELFTQAWQISLAHPWFGAGWFQFGPEQLAMATGPDFPLSVYSHHAHNIVLNFAAELGWPVTILLFVGAAWWFYRCCLSSKVSKETGFATLFFIAVMAHSQVEFPLWYAYVLMPFALLAGMVHQERYGAKVLELRRPILAIPLAVMFAGLFAVSMDYRRVVTGFWEIEIKSMGLNLSQGTTDRPSFTLLPQFYDYFRFLNIKVREDMPAEEIAFMEHTARRFGGALFLMRMSQIYALNGREDDAVKAMTAIYRLHRPVKYKAVYEEWRHAPERYQPIFKRLPQPIDVK